MSILVAKLSNGVLMPAVGLGTYKLFNDDPNTPEAIKSAIELEYRLLDTAQCYKNERDVGKAVRDMEGKKPGETRSAKVVGAPEYFDLVTEDEFMKNFAVPHGPLSDDRVVWVTGKIWCDAFTPQGIRSYVEQHLKDFGRETADLLLLHWPGWPMDFGGNENDVKNPESRLECWRTMEALYAEKKCRAIGVSNYMPKHLTHLLADIEDRKKKGDINAHVPMVNQIEISPVCQPTPELVKMMRSHHIAFTAYSPLGSERGVEYIRNIEVLKNLAAKYKRPQSAVVMRWALQSGYCVIPKSGQAKHQAENLEILDFDLSHEDMTKINELDEQKRFCPDPWVIV